MPTYFKTEAGRVRAIVRSASQTPPPGMTLALNDVQLGDTDNGNGTFTAPAPAPASRRIKPHAYKHRMTRDERIRVRNAAKTNAVIDDHLDMLKTAEYIDLDDVDLIRNPTIGLEAAGLLDAPGRALQILDAPVQPDERAI